MERITRFRAVVLLLIFALILTFFSVRMYSLQILGTGKVVDNASAYTTEIRVRAARGDILDCNGNKLVGNRASYNMVFNSYVLLSSDNPNENLRRLVNLCSELGIEYEDHFPVTAARPYEYCHDEFGSSWQDYFLAYLAKLDIDSDISANRLMKSLRSRYNIPDEWTDGEARRVIGLRYELALRSEITNLPSYEFIVDVTDQNMTAILELNTPGLTAEVSTVREYYTNYAAHVLGYVGSMNPDEWKIYEEKGYEMDAYVGKAGLEKAYEDRLHGTDGLLRRTVDKNGNIISEYWVKKPVSGMNVETSIDINAQMAAEDAMEAEVRRVAEQNGVDGEGKGSDITGAAVVAIEVKTGKILVCGSYPTYDLETFLEDYSALATDESRPLINRALGMAYPPGSTFKICMTIAGIDAGIINKGTRIVDEGVFVKYDGFRPTCMIWANRGVTHGSIDVTEALRDSCNYYFYTLGDMMAVETMDSTAKGLGLGEDTGCEIPQTSTAHRANAETKKRLYGEDAYWYKADSVMAAIGQSDHAYTPLQMAVCVATVANKGTRLAATFMNRVVFCDYSTLLEEGHPRVMSTMDISDEAYEAVVEGMLKVTQDPLGTANAYFYNWGMDINVCGKTGTAEHGSGGSNHGAFVCFAPAEDPQIAIAVYGEHGGQGGNLSSVAKAIMEVYFSGEEASDVDTYENKVS